jgi:hypothetical protein
VYRWIAHYTERRRGEERRSHQHRVCHFGGVLASQPLQTFRLNSSLSLSLFHLKGRQLCLLSLAVFANISSGWRCCCSLRACSLSSVPPLVTERVSLKAGLADLRRSVVLLGELEVNASQSQDDGGVHIHGGRRGGVRLEPPTLGEESGKKRAVTGEQWQRCVGVRIRWS